MPRAVKKNKLNICHRVLEVLRLFEMNFVYMGYYLILIILLKEF